MYYDSKLRCQLIDVSIKSYVLFIVCKYNNCDKIEVSIFNNITYTFEYFLFVISFTA